MEILGRKSTMATIIGNTIIAYSIANVLCFVVFRVVYGGFMCPMLHIAHIFDSCYCVFCSGQILPLGAPLRYTFRMKLRVDGITPDTLRWSRGSFKVFSSDASV